MEVRATTELARILSRDLGDKRQAQKRLEALFDVYQVSSSTYTPVVSSAIITVCCGVQHRVPSVLLLLLLLLQAYRSYCR
jgi:acetolactate synthase small subunit